jgi:hypothetical protein
MSCGVWLRYGNGKEGRLIKDLTDIDEAGRAARAIANWLNEMAPGMTPVGYAEEAWQPEQDWVRLGRMLVVMFLMLSPFIGFGVSEYMQTLRTLPGRTGRDRTQARAQEITPVQPGAPAPEYSF